MRPNRKGKCGESKFTILARMVNHFYEEEKLLNSKTQIKNHEYKNLINLNKSLLEMGLCQY